MPQTLEIVMAVYNNADYITAQLQSLVDQTYSDFQVIIRDDCSSDNSVELIENFIQQYPNKFFLIKGEKNLGARGNFAALLNEAKADYIMFCDADDVWLPTKIEESLSLMQKNEKIFGKNFPLLIHSDLIVVDKHLHPLSRSFWNYSKLNPHNALLLNRLLVNNVVTGCTMLLNKPLRDLAAPVPKEAIMHDWWIALVAAAFGHIDFLLFPTMLYRQHGKNDVGAKNWKSFKTYWKSAKKVIRFQGREEMRLSLLKTRQQAAQFYHRFGSQLHRNSPKKVLIHNYVSMNSATLIKKRYLFFRHAYFKNTLAKNIGMFFFL